MKNLLKLYLLGFFLLSDFIMFAQPGNNTGGGEPPLEDTNEPQPAGIDTKLIYLLLIALAFAVYTIQKRKRNRA